VVSSGPVTNAAEENPEAEEPKSEEAEQPEEPPQPEAAPEPEPEPEPAPEPEPEPEPEPAPPPEPEPEAIPEPEPEPVPEPEPEPEPKPEPPKKPEKPVKKPKKAAPRKAPAKPVAGTAEKEPPSGDGTPKTETPPAKSKDELNGYSKANFGYILVNVRRNLVYPQKAREEDLEGQVLVSFLIEQDGTVKDVKVTKSSGHGILDEAARSAIYRAAPFPKPPMPAKIVIPFNFKLSR
jgi:protein TonB